jgi:3-phytase
MTARHLSLAVAAVAVLLALGAVRDPNSSPSDGPVIRPVAAVATEPVPHADDAADDPAVWLHPTDPAKSLVLGTDKKGGLIAYDLDGRVLQVASDGARPNNVDVLYGFPLGGRSADIAVAGTRGAGQLGVKVWSIDPRTRRLDDMTAGGGALAAFGGTEPYGTCVYRSPRSGRFYYFVNNKKGKQEQYELSATPDGRVTAALVRSFSIPSETEGCVADDRAGCVFIAEERVGIWKFPAEPDGGDRGELIARVGEHGLAADVEGLTLYCGVDDRGYLIASSQGNSTFKVYQRGGRHAFVCTIAPARGSRPQLDPPDHTDGIVATSRPMGPAFTHGALVVQDGKNDIGRQNFKLYRWEDVAGKLLDTAPGPDPRATR